MADTFKCERCRGVFEKAWSDEEQEREYQTYFPVEAAGGDERAVLYDNCFRELWGKMKGFSFPS